jgi:hypothetical protein
MDNKTQLIESDGKSSISEQELVEWKLWAEKWLAEESTDTVVSSQDLKAK